MMETVFKIMAGVSIRYIRAANKQAAKVRAYKVWGLRDAKAERVGNNAPEYVGASGYSRAVKQIEQATTGQALRAMQAHSNTAMRGFYEPSKAAAIKTNNKALDIMARLGLAA